MSIADILVVCLICSLGQMQTVCLQKNVPLRSKNGLLTLEVSSPLFPDPSHCQRLSLSNALDPSVHHSSPKWAMFSERTIPRMRNLSTLKISYSPPGKSYHMKVLPKVHTLQLLSSGPFPDFQGQLKLVFSLCDIKYLHRVENVHHISPCNFSPFKSNISSPITHASQFEVPGHLPRASPHSPTLFKIFKKA